MRIFNSGRFAAVTSTLALVVSLGSVSYAAVVVTGDNIANGTVTTKDVKDKTLKFKDLAPSTKSKLKGPAGPAGPAGAAGATGATGATGPSNVYGRFNDNATAMVAGNKAVLELEVQPGSYWATPSAGPGAPAPGRSSTAASTPPASPSTSPREKDTCFRTCWGHEGKTSATRSYFKTTPSALTVTLYCRGTNKKKRTRPGRS